MKINWKRIICFFKGHDYHGWTSLLGGVRSIYWCKRCNKQQKLK